MPFYICVASGESVQDVQKNTVKQYLTDPEVIEFLDNLPKPSNADLRACETILKELFSGFSFADNCDKQVSLTEPMLSIPFDKLGTYMGRISADFIRQQTINTVPEPLSSMLKTGHVILFSSKFKRAFVHDSIDFFQKLIRSNDTLNRKIESFYDFIAAMLLSFREVGSYKQIYKNMLQMKQLITVNTLRNYATINKVNVKYNKLWISYDPNCPWDVQIRYDKITSQELKNLFKFLKLLDSEIHVETILENDFNIDIQKDLQWRMNIEI